MGFSRTSSLGGQQRPRSSAGDRGRRPPFRLTATQSLEGRTSMCKRYRTPIVAGCRRSLHSTNTQSKLVSTLIGKSPTAQSLNLFVDKNENAGRERHNV